MVFSLPTGPGRIRYPAELWSVFYNDQTLDGLTGLLKSSIQRECSRMCMLSEEL